MAKWNFAAITAAAILVLPGSDAHAQEITVRVDGCAVLARAVYDEVSAAALYGPRSSGPWQISAGNERLFECDTVARTVSRAFTSAMASAGIDVRWQSGVVDRGDYCLSIYLSQCYPDRGAGSAGTRYGDSEFVRRAWSVVSHSVMRQMANPYSSDEVRFNDDHLKLRLGLSLRSSGSRGQPRFAAD